MLEHVGEAEFGGELAERMASPRGQRRGDRIVDAQPTLDRGQGTQSTDPQRVDFDRATRAFGYGYAIDARVHPRESLAGLSDVDEPIVIRTDAEAGAAPECAHDRHDGRQKLGREIGIAGGVDVRAHGVDEPQGRVGRVVAALRRVGRVREQAVVESGGEALQDASPLVRASRFEEQPAIGDQRVARPIREPGVPGDDGVARYDDLVGSQHERGVDVVIDAGRDHEAAGPSMRLGDDGRRRGWGLAVLGAGVERPRSHIHFVARAERRSEPPGEPEILVCSQPAVGLDAVVHVAIPLTRADPLRPAHAIRVGKDEAVGIVRDVRITRRVGLTVGITPCAERFELECDGAIGHDASMHQGHGGASVTHREFGLDRDRADHPAPRRQAIDQAELAPMYMTRGIKGTAAPLVCRKPHALITDDEHRVERCQRKTTTARSLRGHHEQTVIAPSAKAADGTHRVTTEAVGDEPLALTAPIDVAADLSTEREVHESTQPRPVICADRRRSRSITRPVHPV